MQQEEGSLVEEDHKLDSIHVELVRGWIGEVAFKLDDVCRDVRGIERYLNKHVKGEG